MPTRSPDHQRVGVLSRQKRSLVLKCNSEGTGPSSWAGGLHTTAATDSIPGLSTQAEPQASRWSEPVTGTAESARGTSPETPWAEGMPFSLSRGPSMGLGWLRASCLCPLTSVYLICKVGSGSCPGQN